MISMAYPTQYLQEPGSLNKAGDLLGKFGKRLFVISGKKAWAAAGSALARSLEQARLSYTVEWFGGTCTYAEAERLERLVPPDADLIVAVGGGQCMDAAKLAATRLNQPVATVPTLCSTCASTTALSVMYDEEHRYVSTEYYDRCPVITIADTEVLAKAPYRYMTAGIGDTLAKWYEAEPINAGKFKHARTRLGLSIAKLAMELLMEFGPQAVNDCKQGIPSVAVQQVVDANIYLAGLVGGIGQETCRGSGAHSFCYGLTVLPGSHHAMHGELVAFGILCQLLLEGKDEQELLPLGKFYRSVGLPVTLSELHIEDLSEPRLRECASVVCRPDQQIHFLPFAVDEEAVYEAMVRADRWGRSLPAA